MPHVLDMLGPSTIITRDGPRPPHPSPNRAQRRAVAIPHPRAFAAPRPAVRAARQERAFNRQIWGNVARAQRATVNHGAEVIRHPSVGRPGLTRYGRVSVGGTTTVPGTVYRTHLVRGRGLASPATRIVSEAPYHSAAGDFLGALPHLAAHAAATVYRASPAPATFDALRHPGEFIGRDQARVEAQNRAQRKAQNAVAEGVTGYREIRNIRNQPVAGGIALASLLPFGKVLKAGELLRGAEVGRTAAEVDQHVAEVVSHAKAEGYGRVTPSRPILQPGEVSAETAGELGGKVRGALSSKPAPRALRAQQEAARSVERSRRVARGMEAQARPGLSGLERHAAFKSELAGPLPAEQFHGLHGLSANEVNAAIHHIYEHPSLRPFEKTRAVDALIQGAQEGKLPTKSEQKLLERVFGRERLPGVLGAFRQTPGEVLSGVLNIPRSLRSSFDLSAPLRQGLVALLHAPRIAVPNMRAMLRYARSEEGFNTMMRSVSQRPTFALMQRHGLALTNLGEDINSREEAFISNYAEHLHEAPGIRSTPGLRTGLKGVSAGVRASDRSYVGFLNKTRADMFDSLLHDAAAQGHDLHDPHLLDSIASFVNSSTGRGDFASLAKHTAAMNSLFFSPRLLYSRLNFLGFGGKGFKALIPGSYYASLHPFVRQQALTAALKLVGTMSTVLYAAHLAGAKVVLDPRSADFGKLKIGNTRLQIAGGFEQEIRLLAQLASGQIVSSTSGRVENLGSGFGQKSRSTILGRFARSKLAPIPAALTDVFAGSGFTGQPLSPQAEAASLTVPMLWQDMYQLRHTPGTAAAVFPFDVVGVGSQTYGPVDPGVKLQSSIVQKTEQAGLGKPPAAVIADAHWKGALANATYAGQSSPDRMLAAAKIFDRRFGMNLESELAARPWTNAQADAEYQRLAAHISPLYDHWLSVVDHRLALQKDAQVTPAATPPPAPAPHPAPAQAPATTPSAYHLPAHAQAGGTAVEQAATRLPSAPVVQRVSYSPPPATMQLPQTHVAPTVNPGLEQVATRAMAELAAGTYSPAQTLTDLFQTLAQAPVQPQVVDHQGQTIQFQVPQTSGPVGRTAKGAIALAQHYLGTKYVWGGESPSGFDCSGLLQYIWSKMGIAIPRTSEQQFRAGKPVPKGKLKPGDAVFFAGSDGTRSHPGHVGIYVGNGRFIDAPHTGSVVRVDRLNGFPGYVGARRYSR